jgi:Spy/CpxP family protein refolding chaperone
MYKKIVYMLSAVLFLASFNGMGTLMAQTQEQIDQFNKERKAYFTEKLELTNAESNAFWPLYDDFSNRKMKLVEDERSTYGYAHKNADHLSDQEIKETLAKAFRLKEEQLALEKDFYQNKFMKVLPAQKVMKLGKVEWDFRRYLMKKLREKGDEKQSNRGGGGHGGSIHSGPSSIGPPPSSF